MVIIGNNEMVDVDLRKLISCLLIGMSDDSVGVEAYYDEEVRKRFFRLICCCQYRILVVIEMARLLM